MSAERLEQARVRLLVLRGQLVNKTKRTRSELSHNSDSVNKGDLVDQAQQTRDRNILATLETNAVQRLQAVENALTRIDNGTYGTCGECSGEISVSRLEALPAVVLCTGCQQKRDERPGPNSVRRTSFPR